MAGRAGWAGAGGGSIPPVAIQFSIWAEKRRESKRVNLSLLAQVPVYEESRM